MKRLENYIDDALQELRDLANDFVQWLLRQHRLVTNEERNAIMANGVKSTLHLITSLPPEILKGVAEGRLSLQLSFDNEAWEDGVIEWRPNLAIGPVSKPADKSAEPQPVAVPQPAPSPSPSA